jgi:hypothetical protein
VHEDLAAQREVQFELVIEPSHAARRGTAARRECSSGDHP